MEIFLSELKGGLKRPVYLAFSPDPYLLYEAKLAVKKTVPPESVDFAFESFDAAEAGFSAVTLVDSLRLMPFTGGRKVVVLEAVEEAEPPEIEKLARYAKNPDPNNLLFMTANAKKPPGGLSVEGIKSLSLHLGENELPRFINEKAKAHGLRFSGPAIHYLIESLAAEPGLIDSEIRKLALAGKPFMDVGDIKEFMKGMAQYSAFDLVNELKRKDYDGVLRLSRFFKSTHEIVMLMGALNKHYARLELSPARRRKIIRILRDADIKIRALSGAYPVEEFLIRLLRAQ